MAIDAQAFILTTQGERFLRVTNYLSSGIYFNTASTINEIPFFLDWGNDSIIFSPITAIISCETLITGNGVIPSVTIQAGIESFTIVSGATMVLPIGSQSFFITCHGGGDPGTATANRYAIILTDKKYAYAYFAGTILKSSNRLFKYSYYSQGAVPLSPNYKYRLCFYAAKNNNYGIQAGYNLLDINNNPLQLSVFNDYVEFVIENQWMITDADYLSDIWRRVSFPCVGWTDGKLACENKTANGLTLKQFYLTPKISWIKNPAHSYHGKPVTDNTSGTSLFRVQGFFPDGCFPAKPTDAMGSAQNFNAAFNIISDGCIFDLTVNEIKY